MDSISTAALVSLGALVVVVIISCVNEELNPGFLSIGFAIVVGGIWANLSGTAVMRLFPTNLFMILAGMTFLFAMAQNNGTMSKFTAYSVRLCGGNTRLIPLILFLLTTFLTTIGPGNIASVALMAPVAMALATRIGLSAFLMTLVVVGAANGAAFSPFAPTGIISNNIIAKLAPQLGLTDLTGLAWKIHWNSEGAQSVINFAGFMIFGGWAWLGRQKGGVVHIDEIAPKPEPFTTKQWLTLGSVAALILMVVLPGLPAVKPLLPKAVINMFSNVGSVAFILATVLMLFQVADVKASIRAMPWVAIMMVCGVTVLIEVMDKAGGLKALVSMIASISGPGTVNAWLGLFPGVSSAYSSSSGVVVPMFLPLVPGLIKEIGGGNPIALISSINVGAHLVDSSPLSTLGALCIACAGGHEGKSKLFKNLLLWGLAMSVVGAVACLLFFGVLNL